MNLPVLYLKKKEERRILAGHPWVYSNEVDAARSPLPQFEPGAPAQLRAYNDKVLGIGYVNPHTLICARLVSRRPQDVLGPALIDQRLRRALDLRERLFQRPYYRLVFGEHGLVVWRVGRPARPGRGSLRGITGGPDRHRRPGPAEGRGCRWPVRGAAAGLRGAAK